MPRKKKTTKPRKMWQSTSSIWIHEILLCNLVTFKKNSYAFQHARWEPDVTRCKASKTRKSTRKKKTQRDCPTCPLTVIIAGDARWELELTKVSWLKRYEPPSWNKITGYFRFMLLPWAYILSKTCLEYRLTHRRLRINLRTNVLPPWHDRKMGNETLCVCQLEEKTFGQRDRSRPTYFCRFQSRASTRKRERDRSLALTLDIEESH